MRDAVSTVLPRRALACCIAAALAPTAYAGPEGGQIVAGSGAITQTDAATTLITQSSDRLAIDWQSFDVGVNERVRFEQPSAQAAALNRIFDQNPSAILGALEANGHVYLLNPNGMVFGSTARIDVGALIASSLDLTVSDFVAGRYDFAASSAAPGLVVNRGIINAATGGSVTLLGGAVANEGLILADLGQVTLGAGRRARLDFDGDGLLYFEVDEAAVTNPGASAAVSNTGEIRADGGQVLLTARAAQNVFSEVVNNGGLVRAARVDDSGGVVRLLGAGGPVVTTGRIDATGAAADDAGGRVEVLGDRVGVLGDASIDVSGSAGGSILVGGDHRGGGATSAVTLVGADATLTADARTTGDGGDVVVWGDVGTWFRGSASARGGELGGDGGFVEISGESLVFSGTVDTRAPNGKRGTLLFDPSTITIVNGAGGADDGDLPTLNNTGGNDTTPFEISEQALEALGLGTDIVLEATGNIVMQDLADNLLGLATDGSLTIQADVDDDGTGSFTMDPSDTIRSEGGDVVISGAGLTIGSIDITGAAGTAAGDLVLLISTEGATIAGDLTAANTISVNVDTDNDEIATLRLGGTLTASSATVAGSADADDVLEGRSGADVFVGNANAAGTLNGVAFAQFGTLSGLGGADSFDLSADFASVLGGAGNDTFAVAASADLATLDGGADADAVTLASGASVATLAGGAGGIDNDTLATVAGANTWSVTALDAGTLNGNAFSEFENLAGGTGADAFTFSAALTGAVTGGAGNDTFAVNGVGLASLDGGADSDVVTLGAGGTVTALTGGAGGTDNDTLAAAAGANTWLVTGLDGGTLNGNAFADFESLAGGSGADAFTFSAALTGAVTGGAGNDTFAVNGVGLASLDGGADADIVTLGAGGTVTTLTGGAGGNDNDTLAITAGANTWLVTALDGGTLNGNAFSDFENLAGGSGADAFTVSAAVTGTLSGGTGNDTLATAAGANTWSVTALDAGTLNGAAFDAFENLAGGSGADAFTFTAALTGTVTGGAGDDTFAVNGVILAALDGGADSDTVTFAPGAAVGMLTGGAGGSDNDTLAITAGANTWTVTGADAGVLNASFFTDFENLTGGDGTDTFAFLSSLSGTASGGAGDDTFNVLGGSVGAVNGGANTDTLSYAGSATPRTLTVAALAGGGIEIVVGGSSGSDVLQGTGSDDVFVTTGFDAGTVNGTLAYSSFESLQGLAGLDTFTLQHGISGTVDGGADADTFAVGAGAVAGSLVGGAGADTLCHCGPAGAVFTLTAANAGTLNAVSFAGVENLTGSSANDVFNLAFDLSGTAAGGGGNDVFNLGADADATISGGAGTDTISAAATQATAFTVSAANTGSIVNGAGTVSFDAIENLTGSDGDDTFALNASLAGTASGGAGDDTFVAAAGVATAVVGDAGSDRLVGSNSVSAFTVSSANAGTLAQGGSSLTFVSVENLNGGAANDTFSLLADVAGTVSGEGGDDAFALGSNVSASVAGNAGADRIEVAAASTFTVSGANSGQITAGTSSVAFSGVESLRGSAQNDTFTFNGALTGAAFGLAGDDTFAVNDGGSAGAIDGGAGTDTQTYAGLTGPVIVTLGGLTSIENLVGSSDGGDTLVATAADDTFTTTSANAGTVNGLAYASFENLQGSGGADHFTLNHSPSGTVDGGAGNDTFTLLGAVAGQIVGGAGSDRFEVRANVSGELAGGDGDDVYAFADGASATGALDGAAGRDTLDLSAYRSARLVTLTGPGAIDGFDGNATSISTFRNIDSVTADSSIASTLRGRDADATWTVEGANGNVYSSAASSLSFAGFATLSGGSSADRFRLGTANVTGSLAIQGGAGNDRVEAVGDLTVGGTLAITGVETVANSGSAVLAAGSLTIDGATGGVGTAAAPLLVQLASVEVLRSGGGLFMVDRTGDLRVLNAQLGTGDVRIVVDEGNLLVGFVDAGGTGGPTTPPAAGSGGAIELVASQGSILDNGAAVNVRGRTATLRARLHIGEPSNPVTIVVPSNETIRLAAVNATIDNISLATVDDALVVGVFSDFTANATAAAVGAGAASSVLDVSAIDWVGLDPNVTLVDCVEPCVLLPVDQQEDDGFALLRDATMLLVLRDGERLALIPMLERSAR
jgi:filamentous hemagglutinin family protein